MHGNGAALLPHKTKAAAATAAFSWTQGNDDRSARHDLGAHHPASLALAPAPARASASTVSMSVTTPSCTGTASPALFCPTCAPRARRPFKPPRASKSDRQSGSKRHGCPARQPTWPRHHGPLPAAPAPWPGNVAGCTSGKSPGNTSQPQRSRVTHRSRNRIAHARVAHIFHTPRKPLARTASSVLQHGLPASKT